MRIKLPDGRIVYQATGDVVVLDGDEVTVAHYGDLGEEIDAVARESVRDLQ